MAPGIDTTHPVRMARRSAGANGIPVSAPRMSSARALRSTRLSRGSRSVAPSPPAARMNPGGPNGAMPSSRSEPGRSKPAIARPRTVRPPARPESDSSAVNVRTPAQADVAWRCICTKSGRGFPGSVGRDSSLGAQPETSMPHPKNPNPKTQIPTGYGFVRWVLGLRWVLGFGTWDLECRHRLARYLAPGFLYFRFDHTPVDAAVTRERPCPRRDGIEPAALPRKGVTEMILHDGVAR